MKIVKLKEKTPHRMGLPYWSKIYTRKLTSKNRIRRKLVVSEWTDDDDDNSSDVDGAGYDDCQDCTRCTQSKFRCWFNSELTHKWRFKKFLILLLLYTHTHMHTNIHNILAICAAAAAVAVSFINLFSNILKLHQKKSKYKNNTHTHTECIASKRYTQTVWKFNVVISFFSAFVFHAHVEVTKWVQSPIDVQSPISHFGGRNRWR